MDEERLLKAAEESPRRFLKQLKSGLLKKNLLGPLPVRLLLKMCAHHPPSVLRSWLPRIIGHFTDKGGIQGAFNILSRAEVALGFRKPALGIYDHALHFIGGAQKYGCTLAQALQDDFDITLMASKEVSLASLQEWYNLDLSRCRIKVVRIPFFEERGSSKAVIDPGEVDLKKENPFHVISRESGNYDFFVNNSMLEMVYPLANISLFICHFPERKPSRFFYVDRYREIIYNSKYTENWIKQRWNLVPHKHIYPPVDMESSGKRDGKEDIILSVARFDPGGNKLQVEMIRTFQSLGDRHPQKIRNWKLVLAGGSLAENPYLEKINRILGQDGETRVILKVNVLAEELKTLYHRAKLFWHFSGLNQSDPARVEHFGMTIAEAMQNRCVPLVFRGGGQAEIVEDQVSGLLFSSFADVLKKTLDLIENQGLWKRLSHGAYERGKRFHVDAFVSEVKAYFRRLLEEYRSVS